MDTFEKIFFGKVTNILSIAIEQILQLRAKWMVRNSFLLKVVVDSETDSFNFATFLKYEGTKRKELGKSFEMKKLRKNWWIFDRNAVFGSLETLVLDVLLIQVA